MQVKIKTTMYLQQLFLKLHRAINTCTVGTQYNIITVIIPGITDSAEIGSVSVSHWPDCLNAQSPVISGTMHLYTLVLRSQNNQ